MGLPRTIREGLELLPVADKRRLGQVIAVALIAAALETASVAIIFPFVAVAVSPDIIATDPLIGPLKDLTGIETVRGFQIFLGVSALVLVVASNAAGILSKWVQAMFVARVKGNISSSVFRKSLHRDYEDHLKDTASRVLNVSLTQSFQVVDSVINPIVILIRALVTGAAIIGLLLVTRPVATLAVILFLGGSYTMVYLFTRRRLVEHGRGSFSSAEVRHHVATEATSGIKEVKVYGTEDIHANEFQRPTKKNARHTALIQLFSQIPFHALQMIAFGGLMVVFLVLLIGDASLHSIIPTMAFFAFAGYRLMGPLQESFAAITGLRAGGGIIEGIRDDVKRVDNSPRRGTKGVRMEKDIKIDKVAFRYSPDAHDVLHQIEATIPRGTTVAFVGASGAGKTTLVDVIIGLLAPTGGAIRIDGNPLQGDLVYEWRSSIGYVPQDVVLQNGSIKRNVAFGIPKDDIDEIRVVEALRLAHLEAVVDKMKRGVETRIGDRGVRLSGGQRQRIGIARALYRDPDVIVFDEATSNLDSRSEKAITQAIDELSGQKTIIVIAHRLSTVKGANNIFVMEQGRIVSQGTYDELMESDPHFRALALADEDEESLGSGGEEE